MAGIHALDRLIGNDYPDLSTDAEVRAFEQVPYAERVAAESTYDAITLGAARNPDGAAIQFLQKHNFKFCGYNERYYRSRDIALYFVRGL